MRMVARVPPSAPSAMWSKTRRRPGKKEEDAQAKERPGLTSVTSQVLAKGLSLAARRALKPGARGPSLRGLISLIWGFHSSQRLWSTKAS